MVTKFEATSRHHNLLSPTIQTQLSIPYHWSFTPPTHESKTSTQGKSTRLEIL
jgi:hypothetical protein